GPKQDLVRHLPASLCVRELVAIRAAASLTTDCGEGVDRDRCRAGAELGNDVGTAADSRGGTGGVRSYGVTGTDCLLKVLHELISPDARPCRNHCIRSADVPWVKLSGLIRPVAIF